MSEELSQIIALNRRILGDLDTREKTVAEREAEARKALERVLQACAEEKARIIENRELLTHTESLYRDYLSAQADRSKLSAPVALSVVSSREAPIRSNFPDPVASVLPEPSVSVPPPAPVDLSTLDTSAAREISAGLDDLRAKVAKDYQDEEEIQQANSRRWPGMWRS